MALPITHSALDTRRPFLRKDALAAGLTDRDLASPSFVRLFRGCYIDSSVELTTRLRVHAAIEVVGLADFATHETAALLWRGIVPHTSELHLDRVGDDRPRHQGVTGYRYARRPRLRRIAGVLATSPEQTFVDLARRLDLIDLVILGDSLVGRGACTLDDLVAFAHAYRGPGGRRARRAAALVRQGVESPYETRLRLLLVLAGLPEPAVNLVVHFGPRHRRIDLALEEWKVAIEFDGRHHFVGGDVQWRNDNRRREELEAMGWRFVVVVSADVWGDPAGVLRRVCDAVRAQGGPVLAVDPQWRRYFPSGS